MNRYYLTFMKTKHLVTLLPLLACLVACEKEEHVMVIYKEDARYINRFFEQYNIPEGYVAGELQSTELTILECVADDAGNVSTGDTLEKRGASFDKYGYITTELIYSVPWEETRFMLTCRVDYTYDSRHRLTSELTLTGGTPVVSREKKTYSYDDKAGTATEITSVATGDDPFTVTREVVYRLKTNGFIDDDLYEVVSTRAAVDDLPILPTFSVSFVVVERDERGNWTKAYSNLLFRDNDGNVTAAGPQEYFTRENNYFTK